MIGGLLPIAILLQPVPGTTGVFEGTPPQPDGDVSTWVITDDYPEAAWVEFREGTTEVRLAVNVAGRVTGCTINRSSGHPDLDSAACTALVQRARFQPARDGAGNAVAGEYTRRVRWQLPGSSGPYSPGTGAWWGGVRLVRLHVRQDGDVDFCSAHDGTFPVDLDVHEQVCSNIPADMLTEARAAARIRPDGIWVEFVSGMYLFQVDPRWPTDGAAQAGTIRVIDEAATSPSPPNP